MWLTKFQYKQVKTSERGWRGLRKKWSKKKKKLPIILSATEYFARKRARGLRQTNQMLVYISEDHLGKIEDAPIFWVRSGAGFYRRQLQNGKSTLVRHTPRGTVLVSVSKDWWRAKFGSASL